MKKVITLAAFLIAVAAHADYFLFWEFDQGTDGTPVGFSLAQVRVQGNGIESPTYLTLKNGEIAEFVQADFPEPITGTKINPTYADLGEYAHSGYSFAVELYSLGDPSGLVKTSDYVSFADLTAFGSVYENMATTGIKPYNFAVRPTPEPTSGLLVLLGIGALALRRKEVEV